MIQIDDIINVLCKMPGIGKKTASRLAYFLLKEKDTAFEISDVISKVVSSVSFCSICGNYTIDNPCPICLDPTRDETLLCVIEDPQDLLAIEETGFFRGKYHILMGALDPLHGKGPESLRIGELIERVNREPISEILIATNPTVEGEATGMYIYSELRDYDVKISRIATGIPMGGNLEYADKYTLGKAIQLKQYM